MYRRQNEIRKEGERERSTKNKLIIFKKATVTNDNNNKNLTKGYKITLYSESLRATALYAIYINGPNLGCPRGQCEYVHYTLVFDTPPQWVYTWVI